MKRTFKAGKFTIKMGGSGLIGRIVVKPAPKKKRRDKS